MIDQFLTRHAPMLRHNDLKVWWNQRFYFKRAKILLSQAPLEKERDLQAAEAMFYLNQVAKVRRFGQDEIYAMKNKLVEVMYKKGYCVLVEETRQELACWHTRDYNEGWDDWCEKCLNTNVYRTIDLLCFTFLIGGTSYAWHQPRVLVSWNPMIGGKTGTYMPRGYKELMIDADRINLGLAVVWLWLKGEQVSEEDLPERMGFWRAVRNDVGLVWNEVKARWRRWKYRRNPSLDPDWIPF